MKTQEAKDTLLKAQQQRIKNCGEKIQKALDEENCMLDVYMTFGGGKMTPDLKIIAKQ